MPEAAPRSTWTSDRDFTLDGVGYRSMEGPVTEGQMLLLKPREAVEAYEELLRREQPKTILELGIYNGGSAALLSQLARPEKMVVVDIRDGCPRLERFLDAHDLRGTVVPYYGVDQADGQRLGEIVAAEFDGPIDLVIDDASHLEPLTRASFNRLFPHVREGGLYVIEDWSWAHAMSVVPHASHQGVTPLSAFVFELTLITSQRPRMIPELTTGEFWSAARRGPAALRPERFDVSTHLDAVGRTMVDVLRAQRSREGDS